MDNLSKLLLFLKQLDKAKIHYSLSQVRKNAIMISITVPNERWEVEIMEDGTFEIERFRKYGGMENESLLKELFEKYSD